MVWGLCFGGRFYIVVHHWRAIFKSFQPLCRAQWVLDSWGMNSMELGNTCHSGQTEVSVRVGSDITITSSCQFSTCHTGLERRYGSGCQYTHWPLLLPKSKEFLGRSDRFHWNAARSIYPRTKSSELHKHCLHNPIIPVTVRGLLQVAVLTMLTIMEAFHLGRRHPKLRKLRSLFSYCIGIFYELPE